ncbi:hypothetical protein OG897_14565 [Streptomyces sp. NBC_00237]|uniref:hypothetical protein n=1 Tax=Streptomyces sp. NBC_00237 TaxID=2975687 RepID=UPI00224D79D7|nr:hypothetical protein [Streptomyces sp. NBC_00237]MCX5202669.1 hypothetical protein [Streptomyces sp. NBC_00237]
MGTTAPCTTPEGALAPVLPLTGCGAPDDDGKPSAAPTETVPAVPAPAVSAADPDAAHRAAALAAYRAMTAAQTAAYPKANPAGTGLEKHATTQALGTMRIDLRRMKSAGTVVRGGAGHTPTVTALNMRAKIPTATLSDCIDLSKYETYDVKARKPIPLPSAPPLRYLASASMERWDGRWMVTALDPQAGGTC